MGRPHKADWRESRPAERLDAGDIELYHPRCRTKIVITTLELRRNVNKPYLFAEGICEKCDRYVRLELHEGGL